MLKNIFPVRILLKPSEVFAQIAAGRTGWGWPLGLYAASVSCSAFLLSVLPPQFIADSFGGVALPQGGGFWFYVGGSLPGGFLFPLLAGALLSAFTVFLREGRLSLAWRRERQQPTACWRRPRMVRQLRPAGFAAALAMVTFWACCATGGLLLHTEGRAVISALSLAASWRRGALTSVGFTRPRLFSFLSLIWLSKYAAAGYDSAIPRAANAAISALARLLFFPAA